MERDLKSVLASFEKAKEWQWSDLILWIVKVQGIVEGFAGESFQDPITLEKRLWQCLNPALPQGLHSLTLKIYESILSKRWLSNKDFVLFLTGILPYFQYSSSENRCQVIAILNNTLKDRIKEMQNIIQGVVIAILPGLDQDSNPDVGRKTFDLLDEIALKGNKKELFNSVWKGLLTTPRVRLGAITYLKARIQLPDEETIEELLPDKVLVVNAIRSALDDYEVLVRRNAMDLLIDHFPICIREEIITFKEKILIIESVLKLFLKEDNHTVRRIWKWMFPENIEEDDYFSYLTELLIEALKDMMIGDKYSKSEPITVYEYLLEKNQLVEPLMKELSVPLLLYTDKLKEDKSVLDKCIQLLKSKPSSENEQLIGDSLNYYFEENLHGDLGQSISIISLYFTSISSNIEFVQPLFENILSNLHNLGQNQLTQTLALATEMISRFECCEKVDLGEAVKSFQEFFIVLAREELINIKHYKKAARLAVSLSPFSQNDCNLEWLSCLTTQVSESQSSFTAELNSSYMLNDTELLIINSECLVNLFRRTSGKELKYLIKNKIHKLLINRLWDTMHNKKYYKKIVRLLIELEKFDHDQFTNCIKKKLIFNKKDEKKGLIANIKNLIMFWKFVSDKHLEDLPRIFGKREIINQMIEHLNSDTSEISFNAIQWLMTAIENLDYVLNPIFMEISRNIVDEDFKELSKNLNDFINILKHGGRKVINKCNKIEAGQELVDEIDSVFSEDEPYLSDKNLFENSWNKEVDNTLLKILIKVPFMVLLKNWNSKESSSILDVKVLACEFLISILQRRDTEIAYLASYAVLKSLTIVQEKDESSADDDENDEVLHYRLSSIFNIIFFDCNLIKKNLRYTKLVESEIFLLVCVAGLKSQNCFIRNKWSEFISESFEIVYELSSSSALEQFSVEVIKELCNQLRKSSEKKILLKGLKNVLHTILIGNSAGKGQNTVKIMMGFIIENLTECCKSFHTTLEIKTNGTKYMPDYESKSMKKSKKIINILAPIMKNDSGNTVKAFFEVWCITCQQQSPNEETNEKLKKLLGLIISLKCEINSLISGLTVTAYVLNSGKLYLRNSPVALNIQNADKLGHLIYSLACFLPTDEVSTHSFWENLVVLCKELEKSEVPVIKLWILEIINLLVHKSVGLNQDRRYYRSLYEYVQRTLVTVTKYSLSKIDDKIELPNPPSLLEYEVEHKLNSGSLITLKGTLFPIVTNLWKSEPQEKIISQFMASTGLMLQAITTRPESIDIQLTSELLSQILTTGRVWLAKTYRKEIIDFFTSATFFKAFVVSNGGQLQRDYNGLKAWGKIISCVSDECYGDRYSLISELFNKMYTGILTRSTNHSLRARSLKTVSFVIYSGSIDEYHSCTQMICEKLIEFIKSEDEQLRAAVYHCTIILLLRFNSESLNDLWPRLWPHIFTDIWQTLTDPNTKESLNSRDPKKSLNAIFNLLDILITLKNQDFQIFKPMLFYDSIKVYNENRKADESDNSQFRPLMQNLVGSKPIYWKDDMENDDETYKVQMRKLILDVDIQEDDLGHKLRKIIRESIRRSNSLYVSSIESVERFIESEFFN